jgi:hypothetical protein
MSTLAPARTDWRATRRTRLIAVFGAVLANLVVWAIAVPLAGIDLTVDTGAGRTEVGPAAVAVVTMLAGLLGWTLLGLLQRRTRRAVPIWTAVAVAVLVVSLAGPLGAATTTAAGVTLVGMHLMAGAIVIPLLARTAARRP